MPKYDDEESSGRYAESIFEAGDKLNPNRFVTEASIMSVPPGEVPPRTIILERRNGTELWFRSCYMSQNIDGDIAFWRYATWDGEWTLVVIND